MKITPKNAVLPHSQAKLKLYGDYLKTYLRILSLSKYVSHINIYDIFCGTGIYEDGKSGSPIKAFDIIMSLFDFLLSNDKPLPEVTLTVNDGIANNIAKVKKYLENKNKSDKLNIRFYGLSSEDIFDIVISDISNQVGSVKNLIFVDPYGYKDIHKKDLVNILKDRKSEVILFLPVSHMYRFLNKSIDSEKEKAFEKLRRFISDFLPKNIKMKFSNYNIFAFIDDLKNALNMDGEYYSSSFYIQRNRGNYNALFFITPSIKGFEKIIEIKWEMDPKDGKGFQINPKNGLFDPDPSESFKPDLSRFLLYGENLTNVDLYDFAIKSERPLVLPPL